MRSKHTHDIRSGPALDIDANLPGVLLPSWRRDRTGAGVDVAGVAGVSKPKGSAAAVGAVGWAAGAPASKENRSYHTNESVVSNLVRTSDHAGHLLQTRA